MKNYIVHKEELDTCTIYFIGFDNSIKVLRNQLIFEKFDVVENDINYGTFIWEETLTQIDGVCEIYVDEKIHNIVFKGLGIFVISDSTIAQKNFKKHLDSGIISHKHFRHYMV